MSQQKKNSKLIKLTDKQLEEINAYRAEIGFKPVVVKERTCLNCSKSFISEGSFHRRCNSCKSRDGQHLEFYTEELE